MLFEKIRMYYEKGYYRPHHIDVLYRAGVLTAEQRDAILQNG